MIAKINSFALSGLNGILLDVEVDINNGLPGFDMVGLPDTAVKESIERVSSAISNSGCFFPQKKIIINLAPADIKKEGVLFDLAIAVGILSAGGYLKKSIENFVFVGELSLDGRIRAVNGMLPLLISAREKGYKKFIVPKGNSAECSYIDGIECFSFNNL